ncbi:hypothetical protein BGZ82_005024, partial [Podila clonocystis]
KRHSVELLADSLLTQDYTDAGSIGYFKDFIRVQSRLLDEYQSQQARRREDHRAKQADLAREKEAIYKACPPAPSTKKRVRTPPNPFDSGDDREE